MIELNIKEKQRIGRLFKYYRKNKKIHWKEIENIVSKSTYSKIEKGYVVQKDEIYFKLFQFFEISFVKICDFEKWLNNYLIRMNHVLEYYREDDFDSLFNELEEKIGPYKKNVIYEQYYQIITYILNYYKSSKYMTLEEIEDCFNLFDCFDFEETIMIYLLEVIFVSNNNKYASYDILNQVNLVLNKENPIAWYLLAGYYKVLGQLDSALNYFEKSYLYWNNKNNTYRSVRSLMGKFMIYKNIDKVKANIIMNELLVLKENNQLNNQLLENINYTIAMYNYIEQDYIKALSLFEENFKNKKNDRELLFICSIYSLLNKELLIDINTLCDIEHPYKEYLDYFLMKQLKNSNKELINHIMRVIVPLQLEKQYNKQPFWEMFEKELTKICLEDKKYAFNLVKYIDKKNKICRNH